MNGFRELFEEGKFARAEKACRKTLSREASNVQARVTLVLSLLEQGKFETAGTECKKAIKRGGLSDLQKGAFYNLLADSDRQKGKRRHASSIPMGFPVAGHRRFTPLLVKMLCLRQVSGLHWQSTFSN